MDILCYIKEFEGIIGAILGSSVTLLITDWLRRKGKLKIFILNTDNKFLYDANGEELYWRKSEKDKLLLFRFIIELNIYNSSDIPKNMRNLKIKIYDSKKNKLLEKDLNDNDKKYTGRFIRYEKFKLYNIMPKIANEVNIFFELEEEEFKAINNKKIKIDISYLNDKNKEESIKLYDGRLVEPKINENK